MRDKIAQSDDIPARIVDAKTAEGSGNVESRLPASFLSAAQDFQATMPRRRIKGEKSEKNGIERQSAVNGWEKGTGPTFWDRAREETVKGTSGAVVQNTLPG